MTVSAKPSGFLRSKVRSMVAAGVPHNLIAKRLGCSVEELNSLYADDLRRAGPEMRAMVGANLFAAAKAGNIAAIIFWLKTRAGWTETVRRKVSGPAGGPIPVQSDVRVFLPCNGRGSCPKITDFEMRRACYAQTLARYRVDES